MAVTVERLIDLPVIIATFSGHIIADDVREVFTRSLTMIKPEETFLYRISSLEDADSSFVDAFQSVQAGAVERPGTTKDSRFRVILVGRSRWTQMFVQFMAQKQFGGVVIPCFPTMEKALEYVKTEMARDETVS